MSTPTTQPGQPGQPGPADESYEMRVLAAAREAQARRARVSDAVGTYTSRGQWYPDDVLERRTCCRTHVPRQTVPLAVLIHCRGIKHVAHLYDVPEKAVRAALRKLSKGD